MNRHASHKPTRYTQADHARMARAVAAGELKRARAAMRARLFRLTCFAGSAALAVALFYSLTN